MSAMWLATWVLLTCALAATQFQLVVVLYQERGQHDAYNGNVTMVLTDSLANDIRASFDVTSESQLAAESVRVMVLVLCSTAAMAAWLTSAMYASWDVMPTPYRELNVVGYVAFVFVGVILTAPPSADGLGPRRDYNPLLIYELDAKVSQGFHVTAAVLFLFLPLLSTLVWLYRAESPDRVSGLVAYSTLLVVNLAFVGTQIASLSVTGTLLNSIWVTLELTTLGSNWFVYSAFHSTLLSHNPKPPPAHTGYRRYVRT